MLCQVRKYPERCGAPLAFDNQREWDRDSGISPLNHFSGGSLHRTIDTTETTIMILLYGHPAAESVRKWETPRCFPRRLRRLLHRPVWMREHQINVSG